MRAQVKTIPRSRTWRSGSTGDLDTATPLEDAMPYPNSTRIPTTRTHMREDCGDRSPVHHYACNRPVGHGGRHLFAWRHLDGRVREVWGGAK